MLELGELIQTGTRQFAADAAGLVATPRRLRECRVVVVDPQGADPQPFGHSISLAYVLGPDAGGQTVRCVIGQLQRLVFAAETLDGDHRAEDFFPGDAHVGRDVAQ
ncbi:hypothetical protein D3C78_1718980 [compost metagenome]